MYWPAPQGACGVEAMVQIAQAQADAADRGIVAKQGIDCGTAGQMQRVHGIGGAFGNAASTRAQLMSSGWRDASPKCQQHRLLQWPAPIPRYVNEEDAKDYAEASVCTRATQARVLFGPHAVLTM